MDEYYEESSPADYGYNGFENWDDFNSYCDEIDRECEALKHEQANDHS